MSEVYFRRTGHNSFQATQHTSGAWNESEQHIGPALGLALHAVESDFAARRDDAMVVGRTSYDIFGTVPVDAFDVFVGVLRPGRTIELVEARLVHAGRTAVSLRAWLMASYDSDSVAGTAFEPIPPRDSMQAWNPSSVWPGGFLASTDTYRAQQEPGRASYWIRPKVALLDDEPVSPRARLAALMDIANGITVRRSPDQVAFPNIELTASFLAEPTGEWLGFDTRVSFGSVGVGLTHSVLHDESGPIGAMLQTLTVRPRA